MEGIPDVPIVNKALDMHHKLAIIDGHILIIGSFNWTVKATRNNENLIVTSD